ncbi:PspA/IM30 family protein [Bacillus sp. AGMB 02131]|uniref:PspA/IM30 family protein n=1 Tax=Peribacillus faecalis TaxID=2772559 RepID=A0A927CT96_9BACI|nr:PspA/IM30 family protein [Peribacillus faecalis]MBD3107026.1 PspA/IM30 family protein [Peribacillus faecalis]
MSNIFTRMVNSLTADVNELLDKKEESNPIKMLNQYLRQCEQEVEKVRQLVERQYRLKEELKREYAEAKRFYDKRAHQVEVASRAGEVELYDFALAEKNQYEERVARLETAIAEASKQLDELEFKYAEMKHKLKNMQLRRLELMGRENIARANQRINFVLDPEQKAQGKAGAKFEEMEYYMNRLEKKVETDYIRQTIDARIEELENKEKNNESNLTP